MQKGFGLIYILIGVVIITLVAGGTYYFGKTSSKDSPKQVACTMEAKICPDGSAVERTGPNCEFAACPADTSPAPNGTAETANWKIYTNAEYRFSIRYPNNWYGQTNDSRIIPDPPCQGCGGVDGGIFISIKDNEVRLTSKDYLDQVIKPAQASCDNLQIIDKPASLKDLDATIVYGFCGAGAPGPEAIISQGNRIIILSSNLSSTIGTFIGVDYDTINKIFSTFKFTN